MSYPKHPGDPQVHRELAERHLVAMQEIKRLRAEVAAALAIITACNSGNDLQVADCRAAWLERNKEAKK